jgi:hypothetical protein
MWFRTSLASLNHQSQTQANRAAQRAADRRRQARRLLFEGLEHRNLMAFDVAVTYPVGDNPQAVVAADFNNDTFQDLAVANYGTSNVSVLLGKPDGTFQPALTSPSGANPRSLAVGDFDEDGNLDIATAHAYDVSVLLGDGAGSFTPAAGSPVGVGSTPQSVAVGDFDGDGLLDLSMTSNRTVYDGYYCYWYCYPAYHTEAQVNVLLGNGDGSFGATPKTTELGIGFHSLAVASDLNGDTFDDFVTFNADYSYVSVLLGDSSGALQGPTGSFYTGDYSYAVAADDLDGDGDNDLVTANYYGSSASVLLNDGFGGFGAAQTYAVGSNPVAVAIGDFNHDAEPDIASANISSGNLSVLYGRASGGFSPAVNVAAGLGAYSLAVGDFNGDSWLDVAATANSAPNNVSVLLNNQDWPPPPASLSIGDATVTEGDSGATIAEFIVSRSENLAGTVTVNFSTASGTATEGTDYTAAPAGSLLTFGPGETTKTIAILVNGDLTDEFDETFSVNLSNATGANIMDGHGVGTIVDNDPLPRITISDVSRNEGGNRQNTSFVFTVSLSEVSARWVSVNFATADGTATLAGGDYFATSGVVSIAPGTRTATLTVTVRGDKGRELNETFVVNLSNATDGTIEDSQGVGTIVNDDNGGGKGGGKGHRDGSADLIAALLAEEELTNRKRK